MADSTQAAAETDGARHPCETASAQLRPLVDLQSNCRRRTTMPAQSSRAPLMARVPDERVGSVVDKSLFRKQWHRSLFARLTRPKAKRSRVPFAAAELRKESHDQFRSE